MERIVIKHQSSTSFRELSSSESSSEEGLDEACIGDKEGSCRKTDCCMQSLFGVMQIQSRIWSRLGWEISSKEDIVKVRVFEGNLFIFARESKAV
ncbi:hypothetical protein V6N12_007528 [Hibiscus sabdariffa]|uniref:Uncharacterized protein n=1 Tax=Hibiscus sabdariffa TaxID=183260 RepID=A0ABR2F215_9ROSI